MLTSFFDPLWEVVAPRASLSERLHAMVKKQQEELALGLLSSSKADEFDFGYCDSGGNTALHVAVANSLVGVVKKLVQMGAPITLANADGKTPRDLAESDAATLEIFKAMETRALPDAMLPNAKKEALVDYIDAEGNKETVQLVKEHSDAEGGGFTIFIPSLGRERQTVASRLIFPGGSTKSDRRVCESQGDEDESQPEAVAESAAVEGAASSGSAKGDSDISELAARTEELFDMTIGEAMRSVTSPFKEGH